MTKVAVPYTKTFCALTAMLAILSVAGCSGGKGSRADDRRGLKVALIYSDGGLGDGSYNDSAHAGLLRIEQELRVAVKGFEAEEGVPDAEKVQLLERLVRSGYNPIIGLTFSYTKPVDQVAQRHPDMRFAVVDGDPTAQPNVSRLVFASDQGSFLVGAVAALKTRTNTIGFVGGMNTPIIKTFESGYTAGARTINPRIEVLVKYLSQPPDVSGFKDQGKARLSAEGQSDAGADVIFHAAGAAGIGVINGAAAEGRWAIGVDTDQYRQRALARVRDHILTSMMRRVDVAVFDFVSGVLKGQFHAGTKVYDLSNKGVGYATSGGLMEDIRGRVEALKQEIIKGKIKVPSRG
ncbi:BMP family ABC transporter substrate-binding protein [Actinomadura sp. KC06]|uniref:BMP family lipoprotein n=1 Tax=Actinomadura sp. KC06 TaxID=2530369 RepID=UPI001404408D|nr:BMP family ABC transporter substrate-binding protein [Actinomadura sp. KC06]